MLCKREIKAALDIAKAQGWSPPGEREAAAHVAAEIVSEPEPSDQALVTAELLKRAGDRITQLTSALAEVLPIARRARVLKDETAAQAVADTLARAEALLA